jgi:hypothetical protein
MGRWGRWGQGLRRRRHWAGRGGRLGHAPSRAKRAPALCTKPAWLWPAARYPGCCARRPPAAAAGRQGRRPPGAPAGQRRAPAGVRTSVGGRGGRGRVTIALCAGPKSNKAVAASRAPAPIQHLQAGARIPPGHAAKAWWSLRISPGQAHAPPNKCLLPFKLHQSVPALTLNKCSATSIISSTISASSSCPDRSRRLGRVCARRARWPGAQGHPQCWVARWWAEGFTPRPPRCA